MRTNLISCKILIFLDYAIVWVKFLRPESFPQMAQIFPQMTQIKADLADWRFNLRHLQQISEICGNICGKINTSAFC